ncbi:MAG: hypothetical protein K5831_01125 [Brevundimonas sp.]|uniref:fibronectin type III domain-containing protein n=1 Tax=Brevundimonas sp. TaxID=1871086 RepID=UPI00258E957A|nr:phage tail protein [Brevundimonas sp.]MCV0413470.1 hypothetical protein [Brevundimonas sp.]
MYQSLISVVSAAGPIDGWESFKADDTTVTFDGNGKANSTHYANVMWRQTRLGTQPDTALTSPTGLEGGATLPGWGSSYKLSGKASYILTLSENSKRSAYNGREPQPLNVFRGLKVYDPRLDSTYPGGSGSHRLNNPATWTYSNNPILWGLKWSLGLWEDTTGKGAPQVGQQVGGIGAPIDSIYLSTVVECANIADANGWTCAAWPSTDDDKGQVLDAFLQAGGAYYIEIAGKIAFLHRAAPRASVATISAQDTAGPLEIDTTASRIQRKNAIVPSIWSEADGWQITAIEEVTNATWVSEDGDRKRSEGVTFPYVTDATQAAQLACLQIAHTREGISGRIPLKPYMQGIEPGDCFTITEPGFVLDGQKFLCLETSYDAATGVHTVTFVSESDGKYPFALGQTQTPPAPPTLTPVDPTVVQGPGSGDWVVTVPGPAPDGTQFPSIDLTGNVSNENADAMLIAWRAVQEGEDPDVPPDFTDNDGVILPGWTDAGTFPPTTTQLNLTGMQPGSVIWLAIRYKRGSNVSLAQRVGPITVQTLIANPNDGSGDTTPPDVPTGLTVTSTSTINPATGQPFIKIIATWDASEATDLDHYDVEITEGGFTIVEWAGPDASPRFERTALTGRVYTFRVRAVDKAGNASDWTASANVTGAGDTVPPAAPTGFTATATLVGANLAWTNASASDLSRIEVWEHTSNASGSATRIAVVNAVPSAAGSWPRTGLTAGQTRYYWLKSVDTSGNASGFSSVQSITVPDVPAPPVDTTPPGVPTSLSLTAGVVIDSGTGQPRQRITATWTAPSDSDLGGYEVEVTEGGGSPLVRTAGTNRDQWDSRPGVSYSVRVRAVDKAGNRSAWTSSATATGAGDGVAPAAPTGLTAGASLGSIFLRGTAPSDSDLAKIEIWEHTSNASGSAAKIGEVNAAPGGSWGFTRSGLAAQTTRYYWAKAVDTSGNVSGFSAVVSATTTSVTNADVQVGTLYGDRLVAGSVEGDRFSTTTSLPGTITVGTTGVTIETTTNRAADPAARINANTTKIDPGLILVSGSTTLGDWRYGPDLTKINGGNLAANTVQANSMVIGVRGLQSCSCQFEANPDTNVVSWTSGQIVYTDNAGVAQARTISAGSGTFTAGVLYVYWTLGGTTLSTTTDWYTANASSALTLAAYRGGRALDQNYGRTLIDGFSIRTGTVDTTQLKAGSVTTNILAALSVTGDKVQANTFEGSVFKTNTSLPGTITVGSTGVTIATVQSYANDPASRINSGPATLIDPGKILIAGGSTLASWRGGPDNTEINGGKLATNSVRTQSLEVGARGLTFAGFNFSTSGNTLSWVGGEAIWTDDNGVPQSTTVSAGAANFSGSAVFVYWQKGATTLGSTTTLSSAMQANRVLIGAYYGGGNFTATYGRTIIDENGIVVPTLAAIAADLGNITAGNINMVAGTRRLRINPGFGPSGNMVFWVGPTSVPTGSETVDNGLLGISTDDAFFGGRVVSGPFDSGAPSSSLLTISGWTTVATVASRTMRNGVMLMAATWQGTLSPASPAPEAPTYGLNWRLYSTNQSGGDGFVVASGFVDGPVNTANVPMGLAYQQVTYSGTGNRRLLLQLSLGGDTTAASVRSARVFGLYAADAQGWSSGLPTPPAGQALVSDNDGVYLTVPV